MSLFWSKDIDALPITETRIEKKPCANPNETSVTADGMYYPLENDRKNGCKEDPSYLIKNK